MTKDDLVILINERARRVVQITNRPTGHSFLSDREMYRKLEEELEKLSALSLQLKDNAK